VIGLAHGPSYWAFKERYDDAQREYEDAVRFDRPNWQIKELKAARDRAKADLEKAERTGE
jgi:hypothetical protein